MTTTGFFVTLLLQKNRKRDAARSGNENSIHSLTRSTPTRRKKKNQTAHCPSQLVLVRRNLIHQTSEMDENEDHDDMATTKNDVVPPATAKQGGDGLAAPPQSAIGRGLLMDDGT